VELKQNNKGKKPAKDKLPSSVEMEYVVEKIVSHRVCKNGKIQVSTKWDGYSSYENTWEDSLEKVNETPMILYDYFSNIDKTTIYKNATLGNPYDRCAAAATESKDEENKNINAAEEHMTSMQSLPNTINDKSCNRDHTILESYWQEVQPESCKPEQYCHGNWCQHCNALFDAEVDGEF
jgi:hypothetical protein